MTDKTLSFRELIVIILKRWRLIVSFALIIAIILGGYKVVSGVITLNNIDKGTDFENTYNNVMLQYEMERENLEMSIVESKKIEGDLLTGISDYENNANQLLEYIQNSPLMNINPNAKKVFRIELIIDTDYQIMPGMDYQNTNPINNLIAAYIIEAENAYISAAIQQNNMFEFDPKYLAELINIETKGDGVLIIECYADDFSKSEIIADEICNQMFKKTDAITSFFGEHTIKRYNESSYILVDRELENLQIDNLNRYNTVVNERMDLFAKLEIEKTKQLDLINQLNELDLPTNFKPSFKSIMLDGINFGLIGLLAGMLIAIFISLLLTSVDSRIRDEFKFISRYPIRLIGSLSRESEKHICKFDRYIQRLEGKIQLKRYENRGSTRKLFAAYGTTRIGQGEYNTLYRKL